MPKPVTAGRWSPGRRYRRAPEELRRVRVHALSRGSEVVHRPPHPAPLRLLPDSVPVRHPGEGSSRHQEASLERRPERDRRRQARVRHRGEQYWLSDRLALPIAVSAGCQALLHSGQVNWGQGWRRPSSVASRATPPASTALRRAFMVRQALVLHAVEQYRRLFLDPQGRGVPHWLQRRVFLLTTSPDCPSPIGSRPSGLMRRSPNGRPSQPAAMASEQARKGSARLQAGGHGCWPT